MTEIRSQEVHVGVTAEALKSFLEDLRNLEGLLPADKVKVQGKLVGLIRTY